MWFYKEDTVITEQMQQEMMERLIKEAKEKITPEIKKVLLLPPDITRYHSGAGKLTNMLYHILGDECEIYVIPTLGQHVPHTPEENKWMFGDIPEERILKHDWRNSCVTLGEISADFVSTATGGLGTDPIPVSVNRALTDKSFDLIINIGQVVPHEVLGFANHNKNYFIGLGGKEMICSSHLTAALCGIENNLGQIITPLRGCYNYAEKTYLGEIPAVYVQIVRTTDEQGNLPMTGLYVGQDTSTYVKAARYARKKTVFMFDKPLKKVVCFMDGNEFHSTWVANKAIYRTRKVIEDGGELIVIAPGVERFGEQEEVDRMIRKHGYKGTPHSLEAYNSDPELHDLAHAAAHLIHGSTEGRFTVTYAPGKLSEEEVRGVGFNYLDFDKAMELYNPERMRNGINVVNGEEIYFIDSPSLGLWTSKEKFRQSIDNNLAFCERMISMQPDEEVWKQIKQWNLEDINELGL